MAGTSYMGIISDLHALSRFGLVPPRFRLAGGESTDPTWKYQDYMWRCWTHFCEETPQLDTLVINGDLIQGEDIKEHSLWVISTDMSDQYYAAMDILSMIRPKVRKLYIIRGTPYHEGKASETVEGVAKEIGAEFLDAPTRRTAYVVDLRWQGFVFNFTHHMTRGWIYRGTGADRTALLAAAVEAEAKRGGINPANVIVRSHLHMKFIGKSHGKWIIFTPAFQVITPYAIKTMEYYRAKALSDLGAILVSTDGSGPLTFDDERFAYEQFKERVVDVEA